MKEIKDEQESSAQSSTENKVCCDCHKGNCGPCDVCGGPRERMKEIRRCQA